MYVGLSRLTFSEFPFKQLFSSKLEDIIELLLGHGAGLRAKTRPHHQVGEHHLLLRHLVEDKVSGRQSDEQVLKEFSHSFKRHV